MPPIKIIGLGGSLNPNQRVSKHSRIALSGAVESGAHIELLELHEIARCRCLFRTWNRHRRSAGLSTLFQALLA